MNARNGQRLTTDDLVKIARNAELVDDDALAALHAVHHKAAAFRSALSQMTAEVRFAMFCAGELELRTTRFVPEPQPDLTVPPELLAFFGRCTQQAFTVEVDFVVDHESLKAGRIVDGCHRVTVLADDDAQAILIATQMVAATQGMPTASRLIL